MVDHRWNGRCISAYNKKDIREGHAQPGGVAILVSLRIGHLVKRTGTDLTKMGKWAWVELEGSNGGSI